MKKGNIIILTLITFLLNSCDNLKFSESEFNKLLSQKNLELTAEYKGEEFIIYRIYEDYGAIGTGSYYVYHKNNDKYYYYRLSKNSNFTNGQVWNGNLIQTCAYTGQAVDTSKWVEIEIGITKAGNQEIKFNYEPEIPNGYISSTNLEEGIYKWENHTLNKKGKLFLSAKSDITKYLFFDFGIYQLSKYILIKNIKIVRP